MSLPDARTELFRSSWSLYDAIIEANYMYHCEIHAQLQELIAARGEGYAMLDLGCGNVHGLGRTLREFPPGRYLGVDVSGAALADARGELAGLARVELREQDMLACAEELAKEGRAFDLVYSGFAMHHLTPLDKGRLMKAIGAMLSPGGELVLVDVVREEGQTREDYLAGYMGLVSREWKSLSGEEVEQVRAHVMAYDFPEMVEGLSEMGIAAGLGTGRVEGRWGQHYFMRFERPDFRKTGE